MVSGDEISHFHVAVSSLAKLEICDNKCRYLCPRSESFASYPPSPLGVLTALLKPRVCVLSASCSSMVR